MRSWHVSGIRPSFGSTLDAQLDFLEGPLGPKGRPLFASLKKESNPEFFYAGLLHLGKRLEDEGEQASAVRLYEFLQNASGKRPPPDEIKKEAERRWNALNGRGPWTFRLERRGPALLREALLSPGIFVFAAAAPAFGSARIAALSRLAARPAANFLTRGVGQQLLGQLAGISAEGLVLTAGGAGLAQLFGGAPPTSLGEAGRSLGSNLILSGAMRLTSLGLGHLLAAKQVAASGLGQLSHSGLLPPLGLFAGVTLGNYLESLAGWREARALPDLLWESFAVYLQAQIGRSLGNGFFGKEWELRQQAWDRWSPQAANPSRSQASQPALAALSVPGRVDAGRSAERSAFPEHVWRIFSSGPRNESGLSRGRTSALPTLKSLDRYSKGLRPLESLHHLSQLALLLHNAGLRDACRSVLLRASENASLPEMLNADHNPLPRLLTIAEVGDKTGDGEFSSAVISLMERKVLQMDSWIQPFAFGELAAYLSRIGHPTSSKYFTRAEKGLLSLPRPDQGPAHELLAQKATEADEIEWMQKFLSRIPEGQCSNALSDIALSTAKKYAATGLPSFDLLAQALFQQAKTDLELSLGNNPHWAGRYTYLLHNVLNAGPRYRAMAAVWADECQELFAQKWATSKDLALHVPDLVRALVRAGELRSAERWLEVFPPLPPVHRSQTVHSIAVALPEIGSYREALAFLEEERLYPTHRFKALMDIAQGFDAANPENLPALREVLLLARNVIVQSEFHGAYGSRAQGLLQLAERFREAGASPALLQDILDRVPRAFLAEDESHRDILSGFAEWSRQDFQTFVLPRLRHELYDLFGQLFIAASAGNLRTMREAALLLGFRPDGLEYVTEHLSLFEERLLGWIQAWLYYGATFLPQPKEAEQQMALTLQGLVTAGFRDSTPLGAKAHAVMLEALHRISPTLLETTLMPEIRARIETATSREWSQVGHRGWLSGLSFQESDRLLLQALHHLARRGSVPDQTFVGELLGAPEFPQRWKPFLQKALLRRGFPTSRLDWDGTTSNPLLN